MAENLALEHAFAPRRMDPIVALFAQNMANRRREQSGDRRQERQFALSTALEDRRQKAFSERQLALENEDALNREVAGIKVDNARRGALYAEAENFGFELDADKTPEQNENQAMLALKKADADAYKQKVKESDTIHKDLQKKREVFMKGAQPDAKAVGGLIVANGDLLPPGARKPEVLALLRQGQIEAAINKLSPADQVAMAGLHATAFAKAQDQATVEWSIKGRALADEIDEVNNRYGQLNMELNEMRRGKPARWFLEKDGGGTGNVASPFDAEAGLAGVRPRVAASSEVEADREMALGPAMPVTRQPPGALARPELSLPRLPGGGVIPSVLNDFIGTGEGGLRTLRRGAEVAGRLPSALGEQIGESTYGAAQALGPLLAPLIEMLFSGPTETALPIPQDRQMQSRAWRMPMTRDWLSQPSAVPAESALMPIQ